MPVSLDVLWFVLVIALAAWLLWRWRQSCTW
jgi:hypothetical protein